MILSSLLSYPDARNLHEEIPFQPFHIFHQDLSEHYDSHTLQDFKDVPTQVP